MQNLKIIDKEIISLEHIDREALIFSKKTSQHF